MVHVEQQSSPSSGFLGQRWRDSPQSIPCVNASLPCGSILPPSYVLHCPLQVAKLPFLINDGKWHHLCITWTTRDGMWEAFQDGVMRGTGENLAPYHPIKPQGVLVLGQEQVSKAPVGCSQSRFVCGFQKGRVYALLSVGTRVCEECRLCSCSSERCVSEHVKGGDIHVLFMKPQWDSIATGV